MTETIGYFLISIGLAFNLFGFVGLVRLPDVYNRLQAATKCVTLGTCTLLAGTAVLSGWTPLGIKAILCIVFIFFTSPTVAHAIARGAHIYGVKLWKKSVVDKYDDEIDHKLHVIKGGKKNV